VLSRDPNPAHLDKPHSRSTCLRRLPVPGPRTEPLTPNKNRLAFRRDGFQMKIGANRRSLGSRSPALPDPRCSRERPRACAQGVLSNNRRLTLWPDTVEHRFLRATPNPTYSAPRFARCLLVEGGARSSTSDTQNAPAPPIHPHRGHGLVARGPCSTPLSLRGVETVVTPLPLRMLGALRPNSYESIPSDGRASTRFWLAGP